MNVKFYNRYLLIIAGLGGLLYGIDLGVIAAALPYIENSGNYSPEQIGLVVGLVLWGTVISSLFAGQLAEWFGRKKIMILSSFCFVVSIPICCASGYFVGGNFLLLAGGRLLQGIAGGLIGVVVPMYLAECLSADRRGFGTAMFQLILTVGLVFAALIGLLVTYFVGPAYTPTNGEIINSDTLQNWTIAWQTIFWSSAIPGILMFVGSFWLKESPRWLYRKGRKDEALASLAANNDKEKAKMILKEIEDAEREEQIQKSENIAARAKESLLKRKYVLPFLLTCVVLMLQQGTGMNSVLGYAVNIFRQTGLEGEFANWSDLMIKIVNFIVTVFAVMLVDKKGRRFLLRIGTSGIVVGEVGIATMFFLMNNGVIEIGMLSGVITTCFFFLFVAGYAFGPGVCVWLVLTELMPTRIRANGMAIAMILNQSVSAAIASIFPVWVAFCGIEWVFAVLALSGFLYFIVATFVLPETKGKTLEEISKMFEKK